MTKKISNGVAPAFARKLRTGKHKMPADLRKIIVSDPKALRVWEDITPLARNEWICWVISGKKAETRGIRIEKTLSKLKGGMRRPCCWAGCRHTTTVTEQSRAVVV